MPRSGRTPDLVWAEARDYFDPDLMGTLPDLYVPNTSPAHWQTLLDLVTENGWKHEYVEGATPLPVPSAAHVLARPPEAECPQLRVWPAEDLLAIFRFLSDEEIDFDIDLREIQGQDRLDALCGFLRSLGRRLTRPVLMCPEGANHPVVGYDPALDRVRVLGD
ncbi:hypothetical protein PV379_41300 [Streptomyces caniscabiei]|uniref:hypothetical protein n=1 Tax=Streptomyces caniscabiei TaxID=2746961 RepID=UPI0029B62B86|nr:hypothetical protein [Streptomyces caniscabiei]MDX2605847.1 hypothetical protein [Streptomyces caniscabiei]MDX2741215.1 hypothetical protein [Streptomyces caniscabiei]MDX2783703.1 hypothetical protein [Streptomyces caniscabiei]